MLQGEEVGGCRNPNPQTSGCLPLGWGVNPKPKTLNTKPQAPSFVLEGGRGGGGGGVWWLGFGVLGGMSGCIVQLLQGERRPKGGLWLAEALEGCMKP